MELISPLLQRRWKRKKAKVRPGRCLLAYLYIMSRIQSRWVTYELSYIRLGYLAISYPIGVMSINDVAIETEIMASRHVCCVHGSERVVLIGFVIDGLMVD